MTTKERPIIFNDEMVRAILDGRKTQTRRIVKLPVIDKDIGCELSGSELAGSQRDALRHCPHGQPGDRLWVREAWQGPLLDEHDIDEYRENGPELFQKSQYCAYRATDKLDAIDEDGKELGWRPSIHMHRWASRITLEITGVRVERLKDISEADAIAEGIQKAWQYADCYYTPSGDFACAQVAFQRLWESIYRPGSWDANPWVWVIEFKRV